MQKLNFYFDFLSPFSYFAWLNHKKQLAEFALEITYKPVLMGRLFSHHNFPGPGEIKAKRDYELKKCFRYASQNQIPLSPPRSFPFNPLAIIRTATQSASGSEQSAVIDCIFKSVWAKGIILEDPDLIKEIFSENKIDSEIVERSFNKEAKLELKQNIKDALEANIFGVPTLQIGEEFFWGNDSFEHLKDYLTGNDNWNRDLYNELVRD